MQEVIGYMENFKVDGVVTLDVGKAIKEFPTKTCSSDDGKAGKAPISHCMEFGELPQRRVCRQNSIFSIKAP